MRIINAPNSFGILQGANTGPLIPKLKALSLSGSGIAEDASAATVVGAIQNLSSGSTWALTDTAGNRFAKSGDNLVVGATALDYEDAGIIDLGGGLKGFRVTVRETNGAFDPSFRDSIIDVPVTNVLDGATLATLGLSSAIFYIGAPDSGTITGATTGSAISDSGLPSGLTIDGDARTWAWDGTGSASTGDLTLTEALADSPNSPKPNVIGFDISASLPTSIVVLGDSLTSAAGSYANLWAADNPGVPFQNLAVGGTGLSNPEGRIAEILGHNPSHVISFYGANDLGSDVTAWLNQLYGIASSLKSSRPALKFLAATVAPQAPPTGNASRNTYRATANPALIAAVGNQIDGVIDFGAHPLYGNDADASDTAKYSDGLHWTTNVQADYKEQFAAVMDPIVAGATSTLPSQHSLVDQNNVAPSTAVEQLTIVTGMGLSELTTASLSGSGTISKNTDAAVSPISNIRNGDIILSTVSSSAVAAATVDHVLTIGDKVDTLSVTTVASNPANLGGSASATATDTVAFLKTDQVMPAIAVGACRPLIGVVRDKPLGGILVDGVAAIQVATTGNRDLYVASQEVAAGNIVITAQAFGTDSNHTTTVYVAELTDTGDPVTVTGAAVLPYVFRNDAQHDADASITIGANQIGGMFIYVNSALDASSGTTVIDFGDGYKFQKFSASGVPFIDPSAFTNDMILAGGFG